MILTLQEARDVLRIDGEDNDSIISSLLDAIPSYLETTTGYSWDIEPIHPLAKQVSKFILQLWYAPHDTDKLQKVIDKLLIVLTSLGRDYKS